MRCLREEVRCRGDEKGGREEETDKDISCGEESREGLGMILETIQDRVSSGKMVGETLKEIFLQGTDRVADRLIAGT